MLHGILNYLQEEAFIKKNENGKWDITNLGAILFAKNLNDFKNIKRKSIRVIQYDGKNKLKSTDLMSFANKIIFSFFFC